ncbi:MAG TPA: VWA domain-containing protein [Bryobacteraceae bacterium]|nr:VWA domain-containing protein [Bryobacteraceae bacterium]
MDSRFSRRDLLAALGSAALLRAQETKITTDVNVVNVFATVRDKKGNVVRDLTKDDFSIEEDGRPQTVKYFSKESDLPLKLGLAVDTSPSERRMIEQERGASYKFLDQVLREDKDLAFVLHFDADVELLEDFTGSRHKLQKALNEIEASQPLQLRRRDPNDSGPYGQQPRRRGGTTLYDAVLLASDELMKKQTGRKALVLLTDGVDTASRSTMTDAIESAQKSDTMVYSVYFVDDEGFGHGGGGVFGPPRGRRGGMGRENRPDGKKILQRFADETGGTFFEIKKQSLDDIYRQLQDELRSEYSLGYTPDKDTGSGFRAIKVTTKEKGLIVHARDGYYATK